MNAFVQNLYDRYLRLCIVRRDFPHAVIEIPIIGISGPLYARSFDVWKQSDKHALNIKLYSFLIKSMGLNSKVKYLDIKLDDAVEVDAFLGLRQILKRLRQSMHFHSGNNLFLWYKETPREIFNLSREMGGFQWGVPFIKEEGLYKKSLNRDKIRLASTEDEFEDILHKIIPIAFPISLFEEFHARRKEAAHFLKTKKIRIVFTSEYFYLNDTEKFILGEIKETGGRIIGRQHGGAGYGSSLVAIHERIERFLFDYFITWGWDDKDLCPTIPLPVLHLSKMRYVHAQKNKDILFIGSHAPMYVYSYSDYWLSEFVYNKYYNMKDIFFRNLVEPARKRILYRPYPTEYGWNEKKRIREMLPDVRFHESCSAIVGMKTCSLVVIDHPSTSFLEALSMNVPTICFWDNTQSALRDEAKIYFQLLKEAGILYYDPIDASKKVNEIADDPQDWWKSQKVQTVRHKFCRRYVWVDENWKDIWSRTLKVLE